MPSVCLSLSRRTKTFSLAQKMILPLTSSVVSDVLLDLIGDLGSKLIPVCTMIGTKTSQVSDLAPTLETIPDYAVLHQVAHVFAQFCE